MLIAPKQPKFPLPTFLTHSNLILQDPDNINLKIIDSPRIKFKALTPAPSLTYLPASLPHLLSLTLSSSLPFSPCLTLIPLSFLSPSSSSSPAKGETYTKMQNFGVSINCHGGGESRKGVYDGGSRDRRGETKATGDVYGWVNMGTHTTVSHRKSSPFHSLPFSTTPHSTPLNNPSPSPISIPPPPLYLLPPTSHPSPRRDQMRRQIT